MTVEGLPFVVIGNQYFSGYALVYDDEIKKNIKTQCESEQKYDIIEELNNLNSTVEQQENQIQLVLQKLSFGLLYLLHFGALLYSL